MISLSGLMDRVKNALHLNVHPMCNHTFKEHGQIWDFIGKVNGKRRYQLKNHSTCTRCHDDRLKTIGED